MNFPLISILNRTILETCLRANFAGSPALTAEEALGHETRIL